MVWINAGHEIFQEARAQTTTLLEQAIAGYHEGNDVVYAMSHPEFTASAASAAGGNNNASLDGGSVSRSLPKSRRDAGPAGAVRIGGGPARAVSAESGGGLNGGAYEDNYIDNVLATMGDIRAEAKHRERGDLLRLSGGAASGNPGDGGDGHSGPRGEEGDDADNTEMGSSWEGSLGEVYGLSWEKYRSSVTVAGANAAARGGVYGRDDAGSGNASDGGERRVRRGGAGVSNRRRGGRRMGGPGTSGGGGREAQGRDIMVGTVLDASHPAFERQDNLVYGFGQGSRVYPQPEEFPEVRIRRRSRGRGG